MRIDASGVSLAAWLALGGASAFAHESASEHRGDLVATALVYGPQPVTVFASPPDFKKLTLGRRPG